MNQNLHEFVNNDNKEINKQKKLILFIGIIVLIFLLMGSFILYNFYKEKNKPNNSDMSLLDDKNQLWYDFNNGVINADQYVRYNIYNNYDKSMLDEKYKVSSEIRLDNLVEKYFDELSEETIKLYLDYYSLSHVSFGLDDNTSNVKPMANSNESTINLNNVYLSSGNNFLIWYTNEGKSAVKYSDVQKYANLLENIILEYDNVFQLNYFFKSSVLAKGERYDEQLKVLKNNNIDEKYLTEAMHVYIYDYGQDNTTLGKYHSMNEMNNALIKFINNYMYGNEDGTIITPYITLNSRFINDSNYEFKAIVAHELFHHYQYYIINYDDSRNVVNDDIIGESTANWAAAKIVENKLKNNGLNTWVNNYLNHTGDIFTNMYEKVGNEVGYALFRFLHSYEYNVSNGKNKILAAIHTNDGFKYLNDNSTIIERNNVMSDLALKNLNNDYPNNNYYPNDNISVKLKKEITKNINFLENVNLSAAGIDYYSFDLKYNYKMELTVSDKNTINVYVIVLNDGKYEIVSAKENILDNISINTDEYGDNEKLYIVITNNDFKAPHKYKINTSAGTKRNDMTFETNFNNYKIKAKSTMVLYGMETVSYIDGIIDELHQKEYIKTTVEVMGINVSTDTYVDFYNGYTYTQNPLTGIWEKTKGTNSLIDLTKILDKFKETGNVTKINSEQYLVKLTKDDIKGLLKYNSNLSKYDFNGDIFVNVYIKNSYVSKMEYDFSELIPEIEKFKMVIEFYDYNKAGDVLIPADVTG